MEENLLLKLLHERQLEVISGQETGFIVDFENGNYIAVKGKTIDKNFWWFNGSILFKPLGVFFKTKTDAKIALKEHYRNQIEELNRKIDRVDKLF